MAVSMTFNSLLDDLRGYLERASAVDVQVYNQLPSLVNQAERDIALKLGVLGLERTLVSVMAPGVSVYAKPDGWRETVSMNFGTGAGSTTVNPLFPRSYEYLRSYWPDPTQTGTPEFYADHGYLNWLFAPTPSSAFPFETKVYALPPLLDNANQTNWLTDFAPSLILYGALVQATAFVKDDGRISLWQGFYSDQLQGHSGKDLQRIIDRSVSRQEA